MALVAKQRALGGEHARVAGVAVAVAVMLHDELLTADLCRTKDDGPRGRGVRACRRPCGAARALRHPPPALGVVP